jgi:hypothetical protein
VQYHFKISTVKKLLLFWIFFPLLSYGQYPLGKIDTISKRISTIEKNVISINNELSQINLRFDSCKVTCGDQRCKFTCRTCKDIERKDNPWNDYLPLLIALVTAIVALFQIKSNNVTQSRIHWIDELRKALSEFLSIMKFIPLRIANITNDISQLDKNSLNFKEASEKFINEGYQEIELKYVKASQLLSQINLSLNDDEKKHSELIKKLKEYLEKAGKAIKTKTIEELNALENDCINLSKGILKEEWEKAKRVKISYWIYKMNKK